MSPQNSTSALATLILENRVATSNNLAGLTMMIYEIICTMDNEIQLVWLSPWSVMNIIHLAIRYYATVLLSINVYAFDAVNLTNKFCEQFNLFQTWGTGAFIPLMNLALLLRIFALYGQNRLIGAFLVILWLVETSCLFVFMAEAFSSPQMLANPWPDILPGCFPLKPASYAMIMRSGGTSVAFQSFYLAMTLMTLRNRNRRMSMHPMLKVFFRDSIVYCISILGTYLFEAILVKSVPSGILQNIGVTWIMAVLPIVAGRLILNLKHVGQKSSFPSLPSSGSGNDTDLFTSVMPIESLNL